MLYDGYLIKLIDFNASVKLGDKDYIEGKKHQGTPGYMPIEMYNGRIGYSSDYIFYRRQYVRNVVWGYFGLKKPTPIKKLENMY